jgi:hypothetical protein
VTVWDAVIPMGVYIHYGDLVSGCASRMVRICVVGTNSLHCFPHDLDPFLLADADDCSTWLLIHSHSHFHGGVNLRCCRLEEPISLG